MVWVPAASQAKDHPYNPQQQHHAKTGAEPAKPLAPPAKQSVKRPAIYQPECRHAHDREEYSLCVEIKAADEAQKAGQAAIVLGRIQTIGLFLSLVFTGWAAWAAADAAKAARDSLNDARADAAEQAERFRLQLDVADRSAQAASSAALAAERHADEFANGLRTVDRAYVFMGANNLAYDRGANTSSLKLGLFNMGKTPARICSMAYRVFPSDAQLAEIRNYEGASLFETDTIFSSGERADIIDVPNIYPTGFLAGFVEYEDIFKARHTSRFCILYNGMTRTYQTAGNESWNESD